MSDEFIVYTYVHVADDADPRFFCVAWRTAEAARASAEAYAHVPRDGDPPPLEWCEEHDRPDGKWPAFVARVPGGVMRVFPVEILP